MCGLFLSILAGMASLETTGAASSSCHPTRAFTTTGKNWSHSVSQTKKDLVILSQYILAALLPELLLKGTHHHGISAINPPRNVDICRLSLRPWKKG